MENASAIRELIKRLRQIIGFTKEKKLKEVKTKCYIYIKRRKCVNRTSNCITDLN